ncbi:MAG: hypothetical protein BMS9Abin07_1277 [Acidimicrobiia bacterium]|nr:MAG: hypothetical protein BMS9Abin07_1277 [Acidimicrobiia bacterium]
MTGERGTALLGTLVIGFAVVLLVGQALVTIGRISSAATTAEETARYAATWAARHGDAADAEQIARSMAPGARIHAVTTPEGISVTVELEVSLIGPEGAPLIRVVTGRALVPVSQYRSVP